MTSAQLVDVAAWLVGSVAFSALAVFGTQRLLRQDWLSLGEFLFLLLSAVAFATGMARTFTSWSWPVCIAVCVVLGPLGYMALGSALVAIVSVGDWLLERWHARK